MLILKLIARITQDSIFLFQALTDLDEIIDTHLKSLEFFAVHASCTLMTIIDKYRAHSRCGQSRRVGIVALIGALISSVYMAKVPYNVIIIKNTRVI